MFGTADPEDPAHTVVERLRRAKVMDPPSRSSLPLPLVVAVEMGYGHPRPAHALAEALGTELLRADQPPHRSRRAVLLGGGARSLRARLPRLPAPGGGRLVRSLLERITAIGSPGEPEAAEASDAAARLLGGVVASGVGRRLAERLEASGAGLLTTHFLPTLVADRAARRGTPIGDIHCVVTDVELARASVPREPAGCRIRYLVPGERALRLRRLDLRGAFRHRLGAEGALHLDELRPQGPPHSPLVTFPIGSAGAHAELAGYRNLSADGLYRTLELCGASLSASSRREDEREASGW